MKSEWNDFNFFSSFRQDDEEEAIEFYLRLCFDVLFEVFRFGCRRKLTKLERVGHRFHWLVEKYFPDVPFLRLNLELRPTFDFVFLSTHWWDHPKKKSRKLKLSYKRYRYLLTIKSIPHNALTVYHFNHFYNITYHNKTKTALKQRHSGIFQDIQLFFSSRPRIPLKARFAECHVFISFLNN